jgi:hypothetical protein
MTTIKELSPVVQTVNQNRNEINVIISDLNAKLEAMHVGIEVNGVWLYDSGWEVIRNSDEEPVERIRTAHFIGYGKVDDKWQLTYCPCEETQEYGYGGTPVKVGENDDTTYGDTQATALLQAPHRIRLAALKAIPSLLDALKSEADEELKVIAETKQLAAQL